MKQEVSELVKQFQLQGNQAYTPLSLHFRPLCRNWHRHLAQRMKMDYDTFASEFEETLYNSLCHYKEGHINAEGKITPFEHYFASAVRKKANGLKRNFMSQKRRLERKAITFSLHEHDIADTSAAHVHRHVDVLDVIVRRIMDRRDRNLVLLKLQGFSIDEICKRLQIKRRDFWTRIGNLRSNSQLMQVA